MFPLQKIQCEQLYEFNYEHLGQSDIDMSMTLIWSLLNNLSITPKAFGVFHERYEISQQDEWDLTNDKFLSKYPTFDGLYADFGTPDLRWWWLDVDYDNYPIHISCNVGLNAEFTLPLYCEIKFDELATEIEESMKVLQRMIDCKHTSSDNNDFVEPSDELPF